MLYVFALSWLALMSSAFHSAAADGDRATQPKHVLILYSHRQVMPINLQWDRGIRAGIEATIRQPVTIDVEYLDFERLQAAEYRDRWIELLRQKYADSQPDVIIPVNDTAAKYLVARYPDVFPQAAIVLCSVSENMCQRLQRSSRMTGVVYRLDFHGTLDLAFRFFPATRQVIVVSGTGEDDVTMMAGAKRAFTDIPQVEFVYWTGLPVDELCAQASQVESGTVFLFLSQIRDRDGTATVISRDVAERLSGSAKVPVIGLYDTLLGSGVVGGNLAPVEEQGQRAGTVAGRLLKGETPASIPFTGTEMTRPMFDWRQLRKWGIREQDLPPGSLVVHREPTAWDNYWPYISTGTAILGIQSVLIAALLAHRRKRRRAEEDLADQLQFTTLLSNASAQFVELEPERLPGEIEKALTCVVEILRLDRGVVFLLSEDGQH